MNWVRLRKYAEISGDTVDAVKKRRCRGVWIDGRHCKIGPDNKIWINIEEVEKWIERFHAE